MVMFPSEGVAAGNHIACPRAAAAVVAVARHPHPRPSLMPPLPSSAPFAPPPNRSKLEQLHKHSQWGRRLKEGAKAPLRVVKVIGEDGEPVVGVEVSGLVLMLV